MTTFRHHAALAVGLAIVAVSTKAQAETCSIVNTLDVLFGAYDVFDSSATDSAGSISYHCTGVAPSDSIAIEIDAGGGGGYVPRHMTSGEDSLAYNLYLDASRTSVFGDGTAGTSRYAPAGPPPEDATVEVSVYGRIPARQDVRTGHYTDTVTVTISF